MKKILLLIVSASCLGLVSCKDEEPTPPHQVGIWELDSYVIINLPSAYASNENASFGVDEISFSGVRFESYTLELKKDGTFSRDIALFNQPDFKDSGTWILDGDDLTLEADDVDEDFAVERNENGQLWISQEATFGLIKDSVLDTLSQAYVDQLTDEEFSALFDPVSLDLVYAFERQ